MNGSLAGALPTLPAIAFVYLFGISALTHALFAWEKWRSMRNGWRVRESTLLLLALLGGGIGAKIAQRVFRHKTRKQPFGRRLNGVIVLQVVVLGVAFLLHDRVPVPVLAEKPSASLSPPSAEARVLPRRSGPGS